MLPRIPRILLFLVASLALSSGLWAAQDPPKVAASAAHQMNVLQSIKMSKSAAQSKIDSSLYLGLLHRRGDPRLAPLTDFRFVVPEADGRIPVEVVTSGDAKAVADRLASLDAKVERVSSAGRQVSARMRLEDLETLAAMPEVRKVRQKMPVLTQGMVVSEGDTTHGTQRVRSSCGIDGTGVKICVISDGVDSLSSLQGAGELPVPVTVLPGQAGSGDEGSAMLEIIHDLAPGAALGFASASDEATFEQTILKLAEAGCDVIVDDLLLPREPVFHDGPVALAIDNVVSGGVFYVSAAGNLGNKDRLTSGTWEGDFHASSAPDPDPLFGATLHDFGDGGTSIRVEIGGGLPVVLQWAELYNSTMGFASTDFDIYVMNGALTTIFAASVDIQDGIGNDDFPIELLSSTFGGERLLIHKAAAGTTSSAPMLHLAVLQGELDDALATSSALWGHSAAAGAVSIAATPAAASFDGVSPDGPYPNLFNSTNKIESFSSDGLRRILLSPTGTELTPGNRTSTGGVVRQKPDLTAADGVSSATPGFSPFYGTSAAAAHAAAIAGLLMAKFPTWTPIQVRAVMSFSTIDIEAPGFDRDSGAGIVMATARQLCGGFLPGPW